MTFFNIAMVVLIYVVAPIAVFLTGCLLLEIRGE